MDRLKKNLFHEVLIFGKNESIGIFEKILYRFLYFALFSFASHWKHGNQSFRALTKAFGLRFIISVSSTCAYPAKYQYFSSHEDI